MTMKALLILIKDFLSWLQMENFIAMILIVRVEMGFPKIWQFWGYIGLSILIISAFIYAVIILFKLIRREVTEKDGKKKDE